MAKITYSAMSITLILAYFRQLPLKTLIVFAQFGRFIYTQHL